MTTPTSEPTGRASLTITHLAGHGVLKLAGELDQATIPDLQIHLEHAIATTTGPIVIDLVGVGFLGSRGLQLLLDLQAELTAHHRALRLVVGGTGVVTRSLQITGLDRVLSVYPDLASALAVDS